MTSAINELTVLKRRVDRWTEEGRGISTYLSTIISNLSGEDGAKKRSLEQPVLPERAAPAKKARTERSAILLEHPVPQRNGGTDLSVDAEGFIQVHTDGACSNNGRAGAKAGIGVYWATNSQHNTGRPVVGGRHTNNTAEIQAATIAIGQARGMGISKLNVHTDSQFLINCITKWITNWKCNNWMTADKKPVKNKEDLEALDAEIRKGDIKVKWTYVKGHAGIHGNEEADKLARLGAEQA